MSQCYKYEENLSCGLCRIPEFELNLLEICLDRTDNKQTDQTAEGENGVAVPAKKKLKVSMDPLNSSSSHATFNRRLGDCVPEYWRDEKYTERESLCTI